MIFALAETLIAKAGHLKSFLLPTICSSAPLLSLSNLHLTEKSRAEPDAHRLDLCVVGKGIFAELSTDTGLLEPTKRHLMAKHVVAVHPDGTSLERIRDADSGVEVGGVHRGGKTVVSLVPRFDDLLLGLELGDRADRSEDLLLHNLHVIRDVGEDRGLDEVSFLAMALTTSLNLGTSFLAGFNIIHDAIILEL